MFKIYCQENIAYFVKMKLRTSCLSCRKHTNNIGSKRLTMTNKLVRDKARCTNCVSDKSQFMAQEDSKSSQKKK